LYSKKPTKISGLPEKQQKKSSTSDLLTLRKEETRILPENMVLRRSARSNGRKLPTGGKLTK
jgi:hypothetical protein